MRLKPALLIIAALAFITLIPAAVAQPVAAQLEPLPLGDVQLLPGTFQDRFEVNRKYVMSLENDNLLQNYYQEAGMWNPRFLNTMLGGHDRGYYWDRIHWGWESPSCQLRGHFLGHWMSAAAYIAASTGDEVAKARLDQVVDGLARVQERNGEGWAASIPQKYFFWMADGISVWAPHYTVHKTFMGLIDAYRYTGNEQALEVANQFARWFYDWTAQFNREQLDDLLDTETGGMLEAWADLYEITGDSMYRELMNRYDRRRLFEPLLAGRDALTNKHANTTIPEAHGAARSYEVTGDERWRRVAEAYWRSAVTDRGYFATGGQTAGEIWTPPNQLAARLTDKNQEHCTVYNMIRLADYLFRWSGDIAYADYIERNLHNGILAQQNPETGMISYFLPLEPGAKKTWGTPTHDFWCCHGSLVQAHTRHDRCIYYTDAEGVLVAQYIPSEARLERDGVPVTISQDFNSEAEDHRILEEEPPAQRPNRWLVDMHVQAEKPTEFTLRLRLPWWLSGPATVVINGEEITIDSRPSTFVALTRTWGDDDRIQITLPKSLVPAPLPDAPEMVAFLDGPDVLAGLTDEQRTLYGDLDDPTSVLRPDAERQWAVWLPGYRTINQDVGIRFVPLNTVVDETYTVYFPVRSR